MHMVPCIGADYAEVVAAKKQNKSGPWRLRLRTRDTRPERIFSAHVAACTLLLLIMWLLWTLHGPCSCLMMILILLIEARKKILHRAQG